MMPPTAKDIERMLKKDGWYVVRSNGGSHIQYKHPVKKGKVTVPRHNGDVSPNTLKSILKQAGLE